MKKLILFNLLIYVLINTCCKKDEKPPSKTGQKLSADFTFTIKNPGILPSIISFLPVVTNATKYEWDFDNGITSTLPAPEITFNEAKTYKVKLTLTNDYGTASLTKQITTEDKKPVADFTFTIKSTGILPTTVDFTSTSKDATSYSWDFDDGNNANIANPQHVFSVAKTYHVKLTVANAYGTNNSIKDIVISQNLPKADFTFDIIDDGKLPRKVNFANTSIGATSYKWYFGDGKTSIIVSPQNTYETNATYKVTLEAQNAIGKSSITKDIVISPILNSVVVYLVTPNNRAFNQAYYNVLKATVLDLQSWYKQQMGGKTFTLNPLVVDTIKGLHNYDWYNSYNGTFSGTDPRFYGYQNTFYEMQQRLGSQLNTTKYTYLVYVAAPGGGAGTKGFCAMGDQDLKGLLGQNPEWLDPKRWIGGGGHELGHAFGLPHPANENFNALMWSGYSAYPNCILQKEDKDILNASPFFK